MVQFAEFTVNLAGYNVLMFLWGQFYKKTFTNYYFNAIRIPILQHQSQPQQNFVDMAVESQLLDNTSGINCLRKTLN